MIDEKRRENFLKELTELSRKHRIIIGGCGCCSSPYLCEFDIFVENEITIENVKKGHYGEGNKGNISEVEWKVD